MQNAALPLPFSHVSKTYFLMCSQHCRVKASELKKALCPLLCCTTVPAITYSCPCHRVQSEWSEGCTDVVVATIAFGMGIDRPDVRCDFGFFYDA
jgi:hypothetical protein